MSESQETQGPKQDQVELDMQDLEAIEAPGWWTVGGVVVGVTITVSVAT